MKNVNSSTSVKKPFYKKWWFWVIIVVLVLGIIGAIGGDDEEGDAGSDSESTPETVQETESHIYDNAQVKDVMNGFRTEKIGEYSVIEMKSEDVTVEALTDWYFNYVKVNDFNWCMIIYTDKTDGSGVYAIKSMVEKGVIFEKDEYGDYMVGESPESSIIYVPTEDNTLVEMATNE